MPTLQITLNIADEPDAIGYARQKMNRIGGDDAGAVLSRIASANRETHGNKHGDDQAVILRAVAAAVAAAES